MRASCIRKNEEETEQVNLRLRYLAILNTGYILGAVGVLKGLEAILK